MLVVNLKNILPNSFKNLILKIYLKFINQFLIYNSSESYWSKNLVDSPSKGFRSVKQSLEHLNWRNRQYINCERNMNFENTENKVVLDYGCGPGNGIINTINISKPKEIFAVDVSEKAIKLAKKRANLHKINVNFIKIKENKKIYSIKNNSIDVIKCDGVLHHVEDINFVLKEFDRILKKNGVINIMVYNKESIWFHLHVGYELMLKKNILPKKSIDDVFKISTDGFQCPISRCYSKEDFIKICKLNNFKAKLNNISVSLFELKKISLINEALMNKNLLKENRNFLEKIVLKKEIPYFKDRIAGINSYYELRKI